MAKCPSRDQLTGYVAGTLPDPAAAAVADHVEHCPPCESTVVALEGETSRIVQALRRPAADSFAAEPHLAAALARAAKPATPEVPLPGPTATPSPASAPLASAPAVSLEAMIARIDDAGILLAAEARAFLNAFPPARRPADGKALAAELVAAGKLTKFQANLLYFDRAKELIYGEYLIADKIGSGGMGQVFKAEHRRMKRGVAIKLIRVKSLGKDEAIKRFQREVQAAARLNHPNIVTSHDAGEKAGVHYLVMELVVGEDLGALVKRRGPLPIAEAVGLVLQAGRGLAYAHAQGVVHRDIKPSNLLLDSQGTVKVLDLGLARMQNVGTDEGLTQTGQVMGTVDYMAPEQAIDTRSADARSDIYSLGCTLYRLLTNQNLFPGESLGAKLIAHAQQRPPSVRALRSDVPEALDQVLQRMLVKQPEHRYQTMVECLAALEAALQPGAQSLFANLEPTQNLSPAFSFSPAAPPVPPPPSGPALTEGAMPLIRTKPGGGSDRGGMHPLLLWGSLGSAAAILIVGVIILIRNNDGSETKIEGDGKIAVQITPAPTGNQSPLPSPRAKAMGPTAPQVRAPVFTNSLGMQFVRLEAGRVLPQYDGKTQPAVIIPRPLLMSTTEVTQGQWKAVMGTRPWEGRAWPDGDSLPAGSVSWDDVAEFCKELSRREKRTYRLPTEAEWEYACRCGAETDYSFGDQFSKIHDYGWFLDNSKGFPSPVGRKWPNPWGLYDMHGNVWEWCSDVGRDTPFRLIRGGSCGGMEGVAECPTGRKDYDTRGEVDLGFRVVLEDADPSKGQEVLPRHALLDAPAHTNSLGAQFVRVEPGEFLMGHSPDDPEPIWGRGNQCRVRLTQPFLMATTEVTQKQWQEVMGTTPWSGNDMVSEGDDFPATYLSWDAAGEFCKRLSQREKRTYRLPTSAEWEYACRAGTRTLHSFPDEDDIGKYAWVRHNAHDRPGPVARKLPNPWGLHDMHGNVWEWCSDVWEPLPKEAVTDPKGPAPVPNCKRVIRGGAFWSADYSQHRSGFHHGDTPGAGAEAGFRLVLEPVDAP